MDAMRANGKLTRADSAGIKVRALLLARRKRESDLVDGKRLGREGLSPGSFLKFTNRLVHGKVHVPPGDVKLQILAAALRIPVRLLSDDALWPGDGRRLGLSDGEARAMTWLRSLHQWYVDHTGPDAAHKFLSLDFDLLRRETQLLRALARTFGDDALIRVFVISDYEDGRFDREFASIERLAERAAGVRRKILEHVADLPAEERVPGRRFPEFRLGGLGIEIAFHDDLPAGVRYEATGPAGRRRLRVRSRMTDERLAFILAREAGLHLAAGPALVPEALYRIHHWPCEIHDYAHRKAEVMLNRLAAALLAPRARVRRLERQVLLDFSHESVEAACRELGVAPETLLLRIVQLNPRDAHFIRMDAPAPGGRFTLQKLFRGNGLPLHFRYRSMGVVPKSWGVAKSLRKFFAADLRHASQASRHVQVTRFPRCGDSSYVCMSLTYPRYGGGAKALCIGFRKGDFERTYGRLPRLTDPRVAADDTCFDVEWDTLMRMEAESRARTSAD